MEKSSSEDSSIHRSPSLDSKDSDFAKPSTSGRPFGRGFTAGAFYGTAGSRGQSRTEAGIKTDKYNAPKGSKYVVFYLDLSFVFLLEFKKCNMARGCLCCLKYTMFLFNLIFWAPSSACERVQQFTGPEGELSHRPWWAGPRRPWIPEYQVLMGRPLALDRCVLIVFPCQESASQERVWYGRVLSPGTRAECLGWTRPSTMG
eukprot:XP_017176801.1 PREDICTED: tetraspanin-9 isoform X5 [Mus musculus]